MSFSKKRLSMGSPNTPVGCNPDAVQALINEFFSYYDDSKMIEGILWDMFQGSISNAECPTDAAQNGQQSFLYRMLLDLVRDLEKFKGNRSFEMPLN